MVLPVVEVSHLPSSSSYFAAILQPLGLVYISSDDISHPAPLSVVFGTPTRPVLEIRQVLSPDDVHRPVHLVFTAPTRSAVANFYQRGIQANPSQTLLLQGSTDRDTLPNTGCMRATVIDMDGNSIEAVYLGQQSLDDTAKQSTRNGGQTWTGLIDRGLKYGQGASTPVVSARVFSQREPCGQQSSESSHRTTEEFSRTFSEKDSLNSKYLQSTNTQAGESQGVSGTINTSTVVGTLLGLAAGAILTYGIVSSDKHEATHNHADSSPASSQKVKSGPRFPGAGNHGDGRSGFSSRDMPVKATAFQYDLPHRSPWSRQLGGYEARVTRRPPPVQSSDAGVGQVRPQALRDIRSINLPTAPGERGVERRQVVADTNWNGGDLNDVWVGDATPPPIVDCGSTRLSSAKRNTGSLVVPSVASRPLSQMPRQVIPSRAPTAAFDPERETFVSARSRVSSSPVDQTPWHMNSVPATVEPFSRAQWMPSSMSHVSASRIPLPETIVNSGVSAREVPLPASGVGSSCADWGDDNDSIAPSDSISCVGTGRRRGV